MVFIKISSFHLLLQKERLNLPIHTNFYPSGIQLTCCKHPLIEIPYKNLWDHDQIIWLTVISITVD